VAGGDRSHANGALIAALAGGATIEQAAQAAHVSEATVYRRLREPGFRGQVQNARQDLVERTVARLVNTATMATLVLAELMRASHPPGVRLGAARAVLEQAARWRETEDQEQRLAALERLVAEQNGPRRNGATRHG
jgi:DNA-binding MurR/RpiR family transcriptional regulator